jgi:hypothetical protein
MIANRLNIMPLRFSYWPLRPRLNKCFVKRPKMRPLYASDGNALRFQPFLEIVSDTEVMIYGRQCIPIFHEIFGELIDLQTKQTALSPPQQLFVTVHSKSSFSQETNRNCPI